MNKITTYEELLREKERLELQLAVHESAVRTHIVEIKRKLNPLKNVVNFFSNFTATGTSNTLIGSGLGLSLELLIRKIFFSKTGWITKLVGPVLLKNFSANMIKKNKDTLIKKVKNILHMNGKGH